MKWALGEATKKTECYPFVYRYKSRRSLGGCTDTESHNLPPTKYPESDSKLSSGSVSRRR